MFIEIREIRERNENANITKTEIGVIRTEKIAGVEELGLCVQIK